MLDEKTFMNLNARWATCTAPRAYSSLAVGAHEFRVRAIDPAGNVDQTPATQHLDDRRRPRLHRLDGDARRRQRTAGCSRARRARTTAPTAC